MTRTYALLQGTHLNTNIYNVSFRKPIKKMKKQATLVK